MQKPQAPAAGHRPPGGSAACGLRSGSAAEFRPGNAMALKDIPEGLSVHCIEMVPGRGAALVRAAGQYAIVRAKEANYVQVKLPSG